jgi:hypothetical protein
MVPGVTREMCDLHRHVRREWKHFVQEGSGRSFAVGPLGCDRRAQVNYDCHPVFVGRRERFGRIQTAESSQAVRKRCNFAQIRTSRKM